MYVNKCTAQLCDILKNNPAVCVGLSDTWLTDEHNGESYD